MLNHVPLLLIAALGGIMVSLQAQLMGIMDRQMGTLESVFITYGLGGLIIGAAMLFYRGGNLAACASVPWYSMLSGLMGLIIVGSIGYTAPRLGLVPAMTILVLAQFAAAALIDHFGMLGADIRPLTLIRGSGIVVMLVGLWMTLR
ncbi:transporter family-2 protein [Desulfocicer vacuolatum DSM 3385]|uniref:Transporter family-2 protein n=1 Tax=Desulfocicer vacuolatum DSM 3385 TaxID=1121400 RepID=A0A1W2BS84_9BACT|nr:DMT family transporter [Desulfocicer vacuolatum]SMC75472.1 transporter family-2 protein [Desulfocicer vacuolatum DSM 3385]